MYPNLGEVQAKYGPLLKILSINAINPPERAMAEVKKYEMDFQVLAGRGSGVTKDYQIAKLPLLVIIDKDGIIRTCTMYLKYDELKQAVLPLIKQITK
jgi:hypothetical protein